MSNSIVEIETLINVMKQYPTSRSKQNFIPQHEFKVSPNDALSSCLRTFLDVRDMMQEIKCSNLLWNLGIDTFVNAK